MRNKKRIVVGLTCLIMAMSVPVSGMTLKGYYGIKGINVGIRTWAFAGSGYSSASGKIVEGSYNSGWKTGRDVTVTKKNNPFKTCYGYHRYNK